jgi:hypothetical protein
MAAGANGQENRNGQMTAWRAEYQLDELRIGAELGEGGSATIHRCETVDGKPVVLKRYRVEVLKDLDADALRHLIGWRAQLPVDDRERLMQMCAWPLAAVIDGGAVIGVLMSEAPTKFFLRRNGGLVPCHLTFVAVEKERAEKRNYPYYDFPHKIARFGHLLAALQFLHSYKVVVGDLQPNNILTTSPQPDATGHVTTDIFLLDCDSCIVDGRSPLPPMDPPTMRPPYKTDGHSATTDLYKLAKLMIRCLSEDLSFETIQYDKFSNILPSRDFEKLDKLLRLPDPGLTADALGTLAHAWQATVRPDGRLFCRTNRSTREPWTEAQRQAHLAEITPPQQPRDASESRNSGHTTPPKPQSKVAGATSEESQPHYVSQPSDPFFSLPKSGGLGVTGKVLGGIAAIAIGITGLVLASQHHSSTGSSSYATTTTATTSTVVPAPSSTPSQSGDLGSTAQVGDCVLLTRTGQTDSNGGSSASVTRASCSDHSSNILRVILITNNADTCPAGPTRSWFSGYNSPNRILCLEQN